MTEARAAEEHVQRERSDAPASVSVRTLVVAFATLVVPLVAIAAVALGAPRPAPPPEPRPVVAVVAEPPIEVEAAVPLEEPPTPAAPVAADPPLPPPLIQPMLPQPINPFPRWTREERPTFLVLGIDRRPDEQLARTDSILLANVDLSGRRGTVISVPRDLVVSIPGYYADRINGVYALGESEKRPGGGLGLLRETIERNFGVRVDHHVVVDFSCFRGTVDALGGVQVSVPERIYDPYYPTEDYGYKVVRFEPGPQWLNGERALEYARTRYGDTDFGRMRRQQQLLTDSRATGAEPGRAAAGGRCLWRAGERPQPVRPGCPGRLGPRDPPV
jgi:LCP family protein required for cell wall assembly